VFDHIRIYLASVSADRFDLQLVFAGLDDQKRVYGVLARCEKLGFLIQCFAFDFAARAFGEIVNALLRLDAFITMRVA
jgi:hypothetical protein